jgi:uncharacterized protein YbaP (TraB family)
MRSRVRIPRLVLAVLVALISISGLAQSSAYKPGAPVFMWKISSKANTAYLVGSVHLGDKSMYPLPSVMENAFAASSVLIVEVDIPKVDREQMKQLMLSLGSYPDGDDLFKHISPETRAKLDTFLGGYDIPSEAFAKYRPWMVGLTVTMLPMSKAGLDPNEGIDMYFLNKAGDKRVEQLEDAERQVMLLAEFPERASDASLSRSITQAASMNDHFASIASLWTQGGADQLDKLIASWDEGESEEEKAFGRRLREERNPPMTARLEKCLQSSLEKCFMVVGAAHVVGSEGILKQLQTHGYRVEQATEVSTTPAPK